MEFDKTFNKYDVKNPEIREKIRKNSALGLREGF